MLARLAVILLFFFAVAGLPFDAKNKDDKGVANAADNNAALENNANARLVNAAANDNTATAITATVTVSANAADATAAAANVTDINAGAGSRNAPGGGVNAGDASRGDANAENVTGGFASAVNGSAFYDPRAGARILGVCFSYTQLLVAAMVLIAEQTMLDGGLSYDSYDVLHQVTKVT